MLPPKSQGGSFLPLVDAGDLALLVLWLYHSNLGFHLRVTFSLFFLSLLRKLTGFRAHPNSG